MSKNTDTKLFKLQFSGASGSNFHSLTSRNPACGFLRRPGFHLLRSNRVYSIFAGKIAGFQGKSSAVWACFRFSDGAHINSFCFLYIISTTIDCHGRIFYGIITSANYLINALYPQGRIIYRIGGIHYAYAHGFPLVR